MGRDTYLTPIILLTRVVTASYLIRITWFRADLLLFVLSQTVNSSTSIILLHGCQDCSTGTTWMSSLDSMSLFLLRHYDFHDGLPTACIHPLPSPACLWPAFTPFLAPLLKHALLFSQIGITICRYLIAQIFTSISRMPSIYQKTQIQERPVTFKQVLPLPPLLAPLLATTLL